MNPSKNTLSKIIIAILFITYNVMLFVSAGFSDHTAMFWFSYAYMICAFMAVAISFLLIEKNSFVLRDWLFGFPFAKHAIIFFATELIISVIFMIFEDTINPALAFSIQLVLFAFYLIIGISCVIAKKTISEVGDKISDKTAFTKLLRVDAEMIVKKCHDADLTEKLKKFADAVRYSDPMSSEALFELEKEIALTVAQCDSALTANDYILATELCDKATLLLSERNKKVKALK